MKAMRVMRAMLTRCPIPDDKTDAEIITESISKADPANLAAPQLQPNWTPSQPSPEDDFSDSSFMDRVKHLQNTPEKLLEREREVGVSFTQVLRDNGQVFRDDVPTQIVPDRGKWNAELQFADPQDAHKPINLRSYRLSPKETRALALILRDMLLRGTIRPSTSPWGAPVFLVPTDEKRRIGTEQANAHPIFCRMADITDVEPKSSNAFADSKQISAKHRAWVWRARFGVVVTRKTLVKWGIKAAAR